MTITTSGDEQIIEQIVKQLRKLVTVVKVVDFYGMAYVEREMMVIKVHAEESKRGEVLRIADIFRCKVVDVSLTCLLYTSSESFPQHLDTLGSRTYNCYVGGTAFSRKKVHQFVS